jgi:hypothetical protein
MDSIPFLHANQLFTIFFEDDLAFTEVRLILDYLLDHNAFDPDVQETAGRYLVDSDQTTFTVWVNEMDVIIQRGFVNPE